jgi:hypothetical protein
MKERNWDGRGVSLYTSSLSIVSPSPIFASLSLSLMSFSLEMTIIFVLLLNRLLTIRRSENNSSSFSL